MDPEHAHEEPETCTRKNPCWRPVEESARWMLAIYIALCLLGGMSGILASISINPEAAGAIILSKIYVKLRVKTITLSVFFLLAVLFSALVITLRKERLCYVWITQDIIFILVRIFCIGFFMQDTLDYNDFHGRPMVVEGNLDLGDTVAITVVLVLFGIQCMWEIWVIWVIWTYATLLAFDHPQARLVYRISSNTLHYEPVTNPGTFQDFRDVQESLHPSRTDTRKHYF